MHQRSNVLTILWMVGIRKPKAEKRKMQRTRPLIVMVISLSQRAALPRLLFFLTWQKALEARACLLRLIPHYLTQCLAATGKKRPYHLCAKRWFRICICTVLAPWNPVSSSIILYRICLFPCLLPYLPCSPLGLLLSSLLFHIWSMCFLTVCPTV